MEIGDFAFHRPSNLAEACELSRVHGKNGRFLAGGTELLPDLKQHRDATQHLITLDGIPTLGEIRTDGEFLVIGALVTLSAIAESPLVHRHFPALSEAILTMAALQIRNRGTLGGNFCSGVPSADTPPICIAGKAEVLVAGCDGARTIPAEQFFLGPRKIALAPGEVLTEIRLPFLPPATGACYQRFALRRATALAVVGVAAYCRISGKRIDEARVVLGAVAPAPMLALRCGAILQGAAPSEELYQRAAAEAAEEARPISDLRGSMEFRRELVRVLTVRALRSAVGRARGEGMATKGSRLHG